MQKRNEWSGQNSSVLMDMNSMNKMVAHTSQCISARIPVLLYPSPLSHTRIHIALGITFSLNINICVRLLQELLGQLGVLAPKSVSLEFTV